MAAYDLTVVRRFPQPASPPTYTELGPVDWTAMTWTQTCGEPDELTASCEVGALDSNTTSQLLDMSLTPCELWLRRDPDGTGATAPLVFVGPVTAYEIDARVIKLTAVGLLYFLAYMVTEADYTQVARDQVLIVKDFIDLWQATSYGHFGLDTSQLVTGGITRDLTVAQAEHRSTLELVTKLGQQANGFDLWADPATRAVHAYSPRRGTDLSASVIIDSRSIATPKYRQSVAAGQIASDTLVSASAAGGLGFVSSAVNPALRSTFGRVGLAGTRSDVSEQATLDAYAARLLDDSDQPIVEVQPDLLAVPEFSFGSFGTGDLILHQYDHGLGEQTHVVRVRQLVTTMDSGTERFALAFF